MEVYITPKSKIYEELTTIQSEIETELSEELQQIVDRGNYCSAIMARTSKLLADAKYHKDKKLNSSVVSQLKKIAQLPASTANKYVDSVCEEENYLVNWCERINRTVTHQVEWCRTLISKAKAEMTAFNPQ